jgi:phospho-N-acetylmuramoyl-pentapeptide-transferase
VPATSRLRTIAATHHGHAAVVRLAPWFIRELQRKQIGQVVRSDGPESHLSKAGTPTMGGALILLSLLVPTVLWAEPTNPFILATMAITAGYGVIGYVDDYLKLKHRKSGGLKGRWKIFWQVAIASIVMAYVFTSKTNLPDDWVETRDNLSVPFLAFSKHPFELPAYVYIPFAVLVIVAWSNAVNLTDGLDGLAIGPVMVSSGTFLIWSYIAGTTFLFKVGQKMVTLPVYLDIAPNASGGELAVYCGAVVGAGIGFLWYNTYPAQVFMGDVGSLSLGGGLGTLSVFTKNELLSHPTGAGVLRGNAERHPPGRLLQADRQTGLLDGTHPSPFRKERLGRAEDHRPLLDHLLSARAREPFFDEASLIASRRIVGREK